MSLFRADRAARESICQPMQLQLGESVRDVLHSNQMLYFAYHNSSVDGIVTIKLDCHCDAVELYVSSTTTAPCPTDCDWRSSCLDTHDKRVVIYPDDKAIKSGMFYVCVGGLKGTEELAPFALCAMSSGQAVATSASIDHVDELITQFHALANMVTKDMEANTNQDDKSEYLSLTQHYAMITTKSSSRRGTIGMLQDNVQLEEEVVEDDDDEGDDNEQDGMAHSNILPTDETHAFEVLLDRLTNYKDATTAIATEEIDTCRDTSSVTSDNSNSEVDEKAALKAMVKAMVATRLADTSPRKGGVQTTTTTGEQDKPDVYRYSRISIAHDFIEPFITTSPTAGPITTKPSAGPMAPTAAPITTPPTMAPITTAKVPTVAPTVASTTASPSKCNGCSTAVHVELQRMNQANALLKMEISRLQESLMQRLAARYHLTEANARANDTIASLQAELHAVKESAVEQGNLVEKLRRDLDQQSNTGTAASSAESPPPPLLDDTLKQKYHIQVQISLEKQAQIDQLILDATASSANVRHMQCDMDTLRHDLGQVKASLSMCESQLRQELDRANAVSIKHHADMTSLRQTLDAGHLTAARDADARHAREKSLLDQVLALTQERDALIDRLERAEASHKQHLQDMQRESQHLQLLRRKSCGDVVDLTNKYDAALTTVATLQKERDMWHHEQRAADDTIERMVSELKTNHMQLEALEQAVLAQKCEKSGLELKLTQLETTYTTLCQSHSQTVADLKDHMDKLTVAQTQVIKQRSQVHALQVELKATNADKDAVHDKLTEQQATHTKALEKAMQSLVRLCVVAPTVNVHLSGQILPCKTVLPKRDILPVFSSIFLQDQEGTSPTGSSLDSWLQSLLKEMQTSIETHLKNVFQV
ncbi:hypothetical protein DYB36_001943 [Aphanomyces astaci]|uniref:Uncharacterized protein n=1 Tax=Aphanomyces astaci TaxID=112090 RepID=A0A397AJF3_APHAT|nr:hypothetical protein DYB36_001943 [Aphanomyces astaci]